MTTIASEATFCPNMVLRRKRPSNKCDRWEYQVSVLDQPTLIERDDAYYYPNGFQRYDHAVVKRYYKICRQGQDPGLTESWIKLLPGEEPAPSIETYLEEVLSETNPVEVKFLMVQATGEILEVLDSLNRFYDRPSPWSCLRKRLRRNG